MPLPTIDFSGSKIVADEFEGAVDAAASIEAAIAAKTEIAALAAITGTLTGTVDGAMVDIAAPTDTPASADALRDDLAAVTIPAINLQFKELLTKVNLIIAALKA